MSPSDEARALFASEGLGIPPIPRSLESQLRRVGEWRYETIDAPAIGSPYLYAVHDKAAHRVGAPSSLVLAHAGHGANSYAISYYLVLGSVRVLLQLEWGGVYMDNEVRASRIARVFEMLEQHMPALEQRASQPPPRYLSYSDFYSEDRLDDGELAAAIEALGAP